MSVQPTPDVSVGRHGMTVDGTVYLWCGCFYRLGPPTVPPHRPGWRYRCWRHRLLAWLRLIERGPEGGL